jgi:hypothetical protein
MVPQPSAILIWAVRIPHGEVRCLTWQVGNQWCVGLYDEEETYAQAIAPDVDAVCRWATIVRREFDRLGLGGQPRLDPDMDPVIDAPETFDEIVGACIACTDSRARRH